MAVGLDAGPQFETLIEYLRESRGVEFSGYKRTCLIRRFVPMKC